MIGLVLWGCLVAEAEMCPDIGRFPPAEYTEQMLELIQSVQQGVKLQVALHPNRSPELGHLLIQLDTAECAWQQLAYIHRYTGVACRKCNLQYLCDLLGEEDFWAGRMPPPIPYAR